MVSRVRPSPKCKKIDLWACSERGATPSNSPGYPKMQGCFLREIERKIRWSVGYDRATISKTTKKLPESWLLYNHNFCRFARLPKDAGMLPARNWTKNQMVSRHWPSPKRPKNYLRAGCSSNTTFADSQDFPKIQGCSLHKIERKIRWSVGTDQQKSMKKWPDSLLLLRFKYPNFPSFVRDSGMVPMRKIGENQK